MPQHLHWYMEVFLRLSKSRGTTMAGVWYIPVSEMLAYARFLELDDDETSRFLDYMQVLDNEYVNSVNGDSKTPQAQKEESRQKFLN